MRLFAALLLSLLAAPAFAQPLTTTFTYQGELADGATPASGVYDFQFALYDSPAGVTQIGPTLCADNVTVTGGRFTVQLDFGAVFSGQQRHLEVRVRPDTGLDCSSSAGLTTLSPRTNIAAAPHAAYSLSAGTAASAASATQLAGQPASFYTNASNLASGTLPNARTTGTALSNAGTLVLRDASGNFAAGVITANSFSGSGANLGSLNATNITTGTLANARTTGASAATPNTLVLRDGSGNFSAGTISGAFSGNGTLLTGLSADNISLGTLATARGGTGLTTSPTAAGQFLRSTGAGAWGISSLLATDIPALGGDVTGTIGNASVGRLQGRPVSANAPLTNEVLTWTGTQWSPAAVPAPNPALAGDVTGTLSNTSVARLRGINIASTVPAANQVLTFSGGQWVPQAPAAPAPYTAGQGLALSGNTFSVAPDAVSTSMLAPSALSLTKISNLALNMSGTNLGVGVNAISPETDLHIRSTAPTLRIEGNANASPGASIELTEDLTTINGARLNYDGLSNDLTIGTISSGTDVAAITIARGSTTVRFAGDLAIPVTTRNLSISAGGFTPNEFATQSINVTTSAPRIVYSPSSGTTGRAIAHVQLPQGAIVTGFEAFINGGTAANPVSVILRRVNMTAASTSTAQLAAVSSTGGTGPFVASSISNATIDNDSFSYIVVVSWTNPATHFFDFYGCRITYTIDSAIP